MPEINVVFFDLGGVLIKVYFERFYAALARAMNGNLISAQQWALEHRSLHHSFELGELDTGTFLQSVRFPADGIDQDEFVRIYTEIFELDESVAEIVGRLHGRTGLSIISNTDPLHFKYIMQQYPVMQLFSCPVTSFAAGSAKPSPEIYQTALATMQVNAQNALFIDDKAENIMAARSLGMHGIIHTSAPDLCEQLKSFLPQIF